MRFRYVKNVCSPHRTVIYILIKKMIKPFANYNIYAADDDKSVFIKYALCEADIRKIETARECSGSKTKW